MSDIKKTFENLDSTFTRINIKLKLNIEKINENYENDCNLANKSVEPARIITHLNNLNIFREECIFIINEKLKEQIQELNDINLGFDTKLIKNEISRVKAKLVYFKHLYSKNYHCQIKDKLLRYEFKPALDVNKLNKYADLIFKNLKANCINPEPNLHNGVLMRLISKRLFVLPLNKILLLLTNVKDTSAIVSIYDLNGANLNNKYIENKERHSFAIQPTLSNIIILKHDMDKIFDNALQDKCLDLMLVQVFDFNLELIHSFELENLCFSDFVLNQNEIVFNRVDELSYVVFNMNNFKLATLRFQNQNKNAPFYIDLDEKYESLDEDMRIVSELRYLSEDKFYFVKSFCNGDIYVSINLISRKNGARIGEIPIESDPPDKQDRIQFDFYSNIYDFNKSTRSLKVYNSNCELVYDIQLREYIKSIHVSCLNEIVFNKILMQIGIIKNGVSIKRILVEFIKF